jgi:hypothetical protein
MKLMFFKFHQVVLEGLAPKIEKQIDKNKKPSSN